MDKYTKGILTVIAVGIVALNIQILNGGGFISKAYAMNDVKKVHICDKFFTSNCVKVDLNGALKISSSK
ncbi:hypothetical protein N9U84_01855 [Candidatus Pelagibacter sp.]|nr:hypothetical protein [Candidatus Pelagibacter sp.]